MASLNPARFCLDIRALDGGPGDAVSRFLLARVAFMIGPGPVERCAINLLRMPGQSAPDGKREIGIALVGHLGCRMACCAGSWPAEACKRLNHLLIGNLAEIGIIEADGAEIFVVFEANDLVCFLAHERQNF